jgi:two-component system, OmpR family, sensor histidine kinase MtrB
MTTGRVEPGSQAEQGHSPRDGHLRRASAAVGRRILRLRRPRSDAGGGSAVREPVLADHSLLPPTSIDLVEPDHPVGQISETTFVDGLAWPAGRLDDSTEILPRPTDGASDEHPQSQAEPAAAERPRRDRTAGSLRSARELSRRLSADAAHAVGWCAERWRRSLQLRVAATTLLVTGVVVLVVGALLVGRITAGLLDAKRKAAVAETKTGLAIAQSQLTAASRDDAESRRLTVNALSASRGTSAGLFWVIIWPPGPDAQPSVSGAIDSSLSVPLGLRRMVEQGKLADVYAPIRFQDGTTAKGLIVGGPVRALSGSFQVYYLFPLGDEERIVGLVRRTVLFTGLLLMLLVAGIALLVTRQVVRPVRVAAQTAERFAAGRLQERIQVRGEDDLALLASAFNDMADSLQRQIGQLEEMSRLQRRFTSDVSHELRTPLTTVRMAADVLYSSRTDFPPEVARSAELLQHELDRFEGLLADLLEISRYDAHVAVLEPDAVDLRMLVLGEVDGTAAIAERQGSPVLIDLPDRPVVADVDARRVQRILRNLLVNAAEHGEGKPIEVRLRGDGQAVAVIVRDHGVGLRPGEAALVFDRFWRADQSRDRRTGGTGLGLAISLEDARLHGGWLHAWGRPGQGAQFRLTLPVHSGDVLVSSPLPIEPPSLRHRRQVALVASRRPVGEQDRR